MSSQNQKSKSESTLVVFGHQLNAEDITSIKVSVSVGLATSDIIELYSVELKNGKTLEPIVDEMFKSEDVEKLKDFAISNNIPILPMVQN